MSLFCMIRHCTNILIYKGYITLNIEKYSFSIFRESVEFLIICISFMNEDFLYQFDKNKKAWYYVLSKFSQSYIF